MSVKALTVRQPHASLIALRVKPIETRSWSTKYRGRLYIHAGAKRPPLMHLPPLHSHGAGHRDWCRDQPDCWHWLVCDTITDPAFQGPLPQSKRVPTRAQTPTLFFPHQGPHGRSHVEGTPATKQGTAVHLPLGALVATCELVDVVPTGTGLVRLRSDAERRRHPDVAWEQHPWPDRLTTFVDDAQLPYGDFSPGRYAWLLDDIKPVDPPVPCRGYQGLWTPPNDVLAQLEGAAA